MHLSLTEGRPTMAGVIEVIDGNWLRKLGVEGEDKELLKLAVLTKSEIDRRVGVEIAKELSGVQLRVFEEAQARHDDAAALTVIEAAYPEYKKLVYERRDAIVAEIRQADGKSALIMNWHTENSRSEPELLEFTKDLLTSLGASGSDKELQIMIKQATSELEMRVGEILVAELGTEQAQHILSNEDEEKRIEQLTETYPGYKDVVLRQFNQLKAEIRIAEDKPALFKSFRE